MTNFKRALFAKPKNKAIARVISIKSPAEFRKSVSTLRKKGLTRVEKSSLILAKNRARVQLKRKNLSDKERRQFKSIVKVKLPNITKR